MTSRSEVYSAIDGERAYQESQKLSDGSWRDGQTVEESPEDFLRYMQIYMGKAEKAAYDGDVRELMLTILKVSALGVSCMEKFGAPSRETT